MDSIKKYIRGYVRIRLESPAPDRFFSLCVHNRIPLRNLTQEASFYEMELSARDFLRLGRFRRKTDARIHILSKNGLPFFLLHARKRKAFSRNISWLFFVICMFPSYLGYSDHRKPLLYHTCSPGHIIRMGYPLWYGKEKCRLSEADAENPAGLSRCCLGICKA